MKITLLLCLIVSPVYSYTLDTINNEKVLKHPDCTILIDITNTITIAARIILPQKGYKVVNKKTKHSLSLQLTRNNTHEFYMPIEKADYDVEIVKKPKRFQEKIDCVHCGSYWEKNITSAIWHWPLSDSYVPRYNDELKKQAVPVLSQIPRCVKTQNKVTSPKP